MAISLLVKCVAAWILRGCSRNTTLPVPYCGHTRNTVVVSVHRLYCIHPVDNNEKCLQIRESDHRVVTSVARLFIDYLAI